MTSGYLTSIVCTRTLVHFCTATRITSKESSSGCPCISFSGVIQCVLCLDSALYFHDPSMPLKGVVKPRPFLSFTQTTGKHHPSQCIIYHRFGRRLANSLNPKTPRRQATTSVMRRGPAGATTLAAYAVAPTLRSMSLRYRCIVVSNLA